jgi:hypothetical protein
MNETENLDPKLVIPVLKGVQETAAQIRELGISDADADAALKKQFAHGLADAMDIQKKDEAKKK